MKLLMKSAAKALFFIPVFSIVMFFTYPTYGEEWSATQKEVWKSVEAFWESIKQGDEKAVMNIHHDDCVIWWATRRLPTDRYNIRLAYRTWLSSPEEYKLVSYELDPQSIHTFGDVANVYYMYTWSTKKEPKHSSGRLMQTFVKQDNKWLLIGSMGALY